MILLVDTSTAFCNIRLKGSADFDKSESWEAGRELSKGMLGFLRETLEKYDKDWGDLDGIVIHKGPGSFTGLRIGHTVVNTLADALNIPIVSALGDDWQSDGLARLESGEDEKLAMPFYGADANITLPRK